jgi:serine/threonine protein kinase
MGEVWAARDPDLDRRVAVKVLSGALTNSADGLARLQREGRAMARLRHPNVITVYDAAFADRRGLIAMELIDGENFASWLARAHPRPRSRHVARPDAASRPHDAAAAHRDLPHNVLVERGAGCRDRLRLARASARLLPQPPMSPAPAPPTCWRR